MGNVQPVQPVMLVIAAFSRHDEVLDWARQWAISRWGPLACESPRFSFGETDYYRSEMGDDLKKTFYAFEQLVDPGRLADQKLATNQAEREFQQLFRGSELRPLNLDPGHLSESKLILASTKDHAHRIYLSSGIYAEITLRFSRGAWQPWDWTYPDYRRVDFQQFFAQARLQYRNLKQPSR